MTEPDPTPAQQLEQAILGEDAVFNAQDVATETGASLDQAQRLWRALGFPDRGSERAFTRADADAVSTLLSLVGDGSIDFDTAVDLTRAVGQTMARLADWEVGTLVHRVQELESGDDATGSRATAALQLLDALNGPFEELLVYVWRRHLAAAVARVEALGADDADLHTTQVTVGFADIVAFTALTNRLDHDRIGDLVEIFESRCADVVAGQRGRVIKSLGDAVLFVNEDPIRAYDTAEGIISVIGRDPRMPDVRVGLSTGAVVTRLGDVFGPAVNMAARLTGVARRNRIIVDGTTAGLLPEDQFEVRPLPARPVRGFGLVEPVAVRRH
ncbi:MAG TPA: adenylate/guanylate cyclase domain-containing protein [Nocardioides sp.]|jgi:adenylate cyclase|uniref:adenylate/guanylate cyclase domain-containing protein n=1 Tax=Nocardioides sp. TaxID=35761 RepID=UPI002E352429|nr:adenylate/guanylate cyclase domain-containing protein [Nocardioides sp.]HEX3932588.1 adenylate/guanylate cyclase domain-containing protein [Nocardioides sp.]